MEPTVEGLLKLQELENELKSSAKKKTTKRIQEIKDEIIFLKTQIPIEVVTRFYKLYRRYEDALVKANGGICQGCYINLPSSQATGMLYSEHLSTCQNCGRFLYMDSTESVTIY